MKEIIQQGQASTRAILIVGAIIAWSVFQAPPQPLHSARTIVDQILFSNVWKKQQLDPLQDMPQSLSGSLSQYRYEYQSVPFSLDLLKWKHKTLREVPIGAVLSLGNTFLVEDSLLCEEKYCDVFLAPARAELGHLESWTQSSGLHSHATLGDLQDTLGEQIALPIVSQKVSSRTLISVLFLVLVALQLYQCSLLTTASKILCREEVPTIRSWLPFHLSAIGRHLSRGLLILPTVMWILHQTLLTWIRVETMPSVWSIIASLILLTTTAFTLDRQKNFRGQLESICAPTLAVPKRAA